MTHPPAEPHDPDLCGVCHQCQKVRPCAHDGRPAEPQAVEDAIERICGLLKPSAPYEDRPAAVRRLVGQAIQAERARAQAAEKERDVLREELERIRWPEKRPHAFVQRPEGAPFSDLCGLVSLCGGDCKCEFYYCSEPATHLVHAPGHQGEEGK